MKSIIDVEVSTAAFEKFQRMFDAYSEQLRKQPAIWQKINSEHQKLASGFASLGNKMDAHFSGVQDLQNAQEDSEKTLLHSESIWGGIEKASGKTAKNVMSATASLLKWTGIMSGATGLLGYFSLSGMTHLGQDVFAWRKSALGVGMSTGQERAFNIAFARLLGSPQGFLGGINQAVSNLAAQGPLYALGVNPNGSTSSVAVATLKALYGLAHRTPVNQLGVMENAYGIGNLGVSLEDLRRMKAMSPAEFNTQVLGSYAREQRALSLGAGTQNAWTQFVTSMDVAKAKIDNVFINGLVRLTGPLERLAGGFTHLLQVVTAKNGPISQDIDSIASWMNRFNGQITKPEFITGVERFVKLFSLFGTAAHGLSLLNKPLPLPDWANPNKEGMKARAAVTDFFTPGFGARYLAGQRLKWMQAAHSIDPSGLLETVGWLESRMNPFAPNSSKGAVGMMQLMPGVAASLGVDPNNPKQALLGAEKELQHLMGEYHGDIGKTLAAYNWGEGNLNHDIARYGNAWAGHVPAETLGYILKAMRMMQITVNIQGAPPGFSASASISAQGATR